MACRSARRRSCSVNDRVSELPWGDETKERHTSTQQALRSCARPVTVDAGMHAELPAADTLLEGTGGSVRAACAAQFSLLAWVEGVQQHCLLLAGHDRRRNGDGDAAAADDLLHGLDRADESQVLGDVSWASLQSIGQTHRENGKKLGDMVGPAVDRVQAIAFNRLEKLVQVPSGEENLRRWRRLLVRDVGRVARAEIDFGD